TLGPVLRDQAIVYDTVDSSADFPLGWIDTQDGGHYRVVPGPQPALFDHVVGPQSWKKFLFPPTQTVFRSRLEPDGQVRFEAPMTASHRQAFIGVRACELHAIQIQDKVFLHSGSVD